MQEEMKLHVSGHHRNARRDAAASLAHQKYCVGSDLSHICTWTCEVIPG